MALLTMDDREKGMELKPSKNKLGKVINKMVRGWERDLRLWAAQGTLGPRRMRLGEEGRRIYGEGGLTA